MNPFLLGILIASTIFIIGYLYAIYGNVFLQSPKYKYHHENWMANLNAETQLKDIVFPGSHDSLIFKPIDFKKKYTGIDKPATTYQKVTFIPGINHKVNRWTQTQNSTILEQLNNGIRSFDFRVAEKDNICYGYHTYIATKFIPSLKDIKTFLEKNPKEIILIKIKTKTKLCSKMFYTYLEDKIFNFTPSDNVKNLTLEDLWQRNKNIIISIKNKIITSDWLNSYNEEEKTDYIKTRLKIRHKTKVNDNKFYNLEWTVTPQTTQILFNYDSLLYKSYKFNQKLPLFLETLSDKLKSQINIISIDNSSSIDLYTIIKKNFPRMRNKIDLN